MQKKGTLVASFKVWLVKICLCRERMFSESFIQWVLNFVSVPVMLCGL